MPGSTFADSLTLGICSDLDNVAYSVELHSRQCSSCTHSPEKGTPGPSSRGAATWEGRFTGVSFFLLRLGDQLRARDDDEQISIELQVARGAPL